MTTRLILNTSILSIALLVGCANQQPKESVSVEKKGNITIVHHRARTAKGSRDKIEAISAKGEITSAVIEVYDVGRMPTADGNGMNEAHRVYAIGESAHWNTNLPLKSSTAAKGPKTVFTPPSYSPIPADQRIEDAVTEANAAKQKMQSATDDIQKRLAQDNNLKGELQDQIDTNQRLQDQLNAALNTPKHDKPAPTTDAEKAAENSMSDLQKFGQQAAQ